MRSYVHSATTAVALLAFAACTAGDVASPDDQGNGNLFSVSQDTSVGSTTDTGDSIIAITDGVSNARGNSAPTSWIIEPKNKSKYTAGTAINFKGAASDPETGNLSGSSLVWSSSLDGKFGTGESVVWSKLSVGTHVITLTATDPAGLTFSHNRVITITPSTTNVAPVASITSPSADLSIVQGTRVTFSGTGRDVEDGDLSGSSLTWTSSRDGALGSGSSISTSSLTAGSHIITLAVVDSKGSRTTASRNVEVTTASAPPPPSEPPTSTDTKTSDNQAPSGWISTPANGSTFAQGTSISFTGSASDPEDGKLSGSSIVWSSSRDGNIGTGTAFTRSNLSVGTHTITMTSTDSRGASFSHNRVITITAATSVNQAPRASFSANCVLLVCSFDAGASSDDHGITQYSWNFGNGATKSVTVPLISNTYLVAGSVTVSLTVRDASGLTNTVTKSISLIGSTQQETPSSPSTIPSGSSIEPSGMSLLAENPFNCLGCDGWYLSQRYSNGAVVVQDGSAPRSGSSVVQLNFTSSLPGGSAPATIGKGISQKRTVYASIWMKMSSNYVGHSTGVNKVLHFWTRGRNEAIFVIRGSGTGALKASFSVQALAAPYTNGSRTETAANLDPNVGSCPVGRGEWHKYEMLVVDNTPGVADGTIQYWMDGVKCGDYKGFMFVGAGENNKWEEIQWSPTWGGVGGSISQSFYVQMDHLYISGK